MSSHPTGQRAVVGLPIAQAITKLAVNSDNMLAHERVIEAVMKEFDSVLPVRFGTIASSADEIRNLLGRRYRELKNALRDLDHKVELGVKGVWKDMDVIFKEVVDENKEIKRLREEIAITETQKDFRGSVAAKMEVGRMVETALEKKKEKEAQSIVDALRRTSSDYKLNKTVGDEMFVAPPFWWIKAGKKNLII